MKISRVKKTLTTPYALYIIDDQSFYIDDLKKKYEEKEKYTISIFSSLRRFTEFLSQQITLKNVIKIVVISLKAGNGEENSPEKVVERLLVSFPFLNIVKIADEKELPKDESYKKSGRVIMVKRNENTLLRVENSIKLFIGQRTLEKKVRGKRIGDRLFLASVLMFLLAILVVRILYPKIFYF
jgi:hypothetical protein